MHGELIYNDSRTDRELRLPGNAILRSDVELDWEIHDHDIDEAELHDALVVLEAARERGESVSLLFLEAGSPLAELESGPHVELEERQPLTYRLTDVSESGRIRLSRIEGRE